MGNRRLAAMECGTLHQSFLLPECEARGAQGSDRVGCVAFHRSLAWSRGTKDCVRRAIEAGIPTYLVDSDQVQPQRLEAGDLRLN